MKALRRRFTALALMLLCGVVGAAFWPSAGPVKTDDSPHNALTRAVFDPNFDGQSDQEDNYDGGSLVALPVERLRTALPKTRSVSAPFVAGSLDFVPLSPRLTRGPPIAFVV